VDPRGPGEFVFVNEHGAFAATIRSSPRSGLPIKVVAALGGLPDAFEE
jgi:hypothetical protein